MKVLVFSFLTLFALHSFASSGKEIVVCPVSRSVDWIFQVSESDLSLKLIEFDKVSEQKTVVYEAAKAFWSEAQNFDSLIAVDKGKSMMVLNLHHHYQQDGSIFHVAELEFSGENIPFNGMSVLEGCLKP